MSGKQGLVANDQAAGTTAPPATARGAPLFLLGALVFLLGIVGYFIQFFALKHLAVPWYAPLLATAGVASMFAAVRRRPSVGRIVGLGFFAFLCAAEWWVLAWAIRLPAYTGPAQVGKPFPAFSSTLADGRPFGPRDLRGGKASIVLFFRGRW